MLSGNGYGFFLHGFEQGRLGFGWCTVNFVGQNDVGKHRPFDETEFAFFVQDFGSENIGRHKVGRKLNTRIVQPQ